MNEIYRRFMLLVEGEQKKAFLTLVKQKGLTREDLMLILKSVKIRSTKDKSRKTIEIRKPYSNENVKITLPKCAADEIPVLIRKPYNDEITVFVVRKAPKPL